MKEQWNDTLKELREADPLVHEQPWYQQHYMGQWVVIESNKIYRYNATRNDWNGILPDYGWKRWNWVLGIDLGFEDATAFALLAYHEHDPHTYIVAADKWKGLTITDTADKIREWMGNYPIDYFIVDGANKQAVEEMVKHHQLPLEAADKKDKVSFIRIMNSGFLNGKIKVNPLTCAPLTEEYDKAIWQKKWLEKGIYKEDPAFHPDCCDAALYAYRYCYSYAWTPVQKKLTLEQQVEAQKQEWNRELEARKQEKEYSMEGSEYLFDGL